MLVLVPVFQECARNVSGMCHECVWNVPGMCQECVRNASGMRQECVRNVSGLCPECIRYVSGLCLDFSILPILKSQPRCPGGLSTVRLIYF